MSIVVDIDHVIVLPPLTLNQHTLEQPLRVGHAYRCRGSQPLPLRNTSTRVRCSGVLIKIGRKDQQDQKRGWAEIQHIWKIITAVGPKQPGVDTKFSTLPMTRYPESITQNSSQHGFAG